MIEIKITIEAALTLLLERMKFELKFRQKGGLIHPNLKLEELSYDQQLEIVEAAIFDTILLLPFDLILQETNLVYIITETVKSLSFILKKEQFINYSQKKARKLIQPIIKNFASIETNKDFQYN
ncbi:MAG: hypothetical protein FJ214_00850 [Ignavibacteria bacterium]|nr:hypothetical protein [Ignavibacteria bacterium]